MRPDPACRTFNSSAVEVSTICVVLLGSFPERIVQTVIEEMKSRLKDPDLARLFENTFPNTLGMRHNSLPCIAC